jgi:hypothetical protein
VSQKQDALVITWETRFIGFRYDDHYRVLDRATGLVASYLVQGVERAREWGTYDLACTFAGKVTDAGPRPSGFQPKEYNDKLGLNEPLCWAPCWRYR